MDELEVFSKFDGLALEICNFPDIVRQEANKGDNLTFWARMLAFSGKEINGESVNDNVDV